MFKSLGVILVCTAVLGAPWTSGSAREAPKPKLQPSLCQPAEKPLFQCVLRTKQVAVCASGEPGHSVVQYRFGRPGKVELAYPSNPASGSGTLKWANAGWSGGAAMQIHFESASNRYVLYSSMVRTGFGSDGLNYPMDQLGLFVTRTGRLVFDEHCRLDARLEGGEDSWIDEANTKASLLEGKWIDGPDPFYERWGKGSTRS